MRRRNFLALYPGLLASGAGANAAESGKRVRIDLNGPWVHSVGGQAIRTVQVPSSQRPSGVYDLTREFALPRLARGERAYVCFEAITYFGRARFNGAELGTLDPYVPVEFEITRTARERGNTLSVAIADLPTDPAGDGADALSMGVNPGWEAAGGIIRDAWAEIRPATWIQNARLSYALDANGRSAECRVHTWLDSGSRGKGRVRATLHRAGREVAAASRDIELNAGPNETELSFTLANPALWSPETPDLYDAVVRYEMAEASDDFAFRTGFRTFRANGPTFELNGSRVYLNGVCRHDLWKDQGFTLTREQMRRDMQSIKAMGANHVRLVHYPHHRYVVELADELGLLVTEEPGYWQVDFAKIPRSMIDLGLRLLETTIRRDWNSPSVVAWLLANECRLTADYLREGKQRCRQLDPLQRLVSAANDMGMEKAKPIFVESGMDFFDDHPYTFDLTSFRKIADFYGQDRPLTFTEWGGKEIGQSQQVMPHTVDALLDLYDAEKLAGTAFWSWQDLPEFSRIDPEMKNGILESGVVTESREPRPLVDMELRRLFAGGPRYRTGPAPRPEVLPLRKAVWAPNARMDPIDLGAVASSASQKEAWSEFEAMIADYWSKQGYAANQWARTGRAFRLWGDPHIEIAGARFVAPSAAGSVRPLVITQRQSRVEIPVNRALSRLHILGNVSCPDGFPTAAAEGTPAAELQVTDEDGATERFVLRHGYEVARANMIYKSGRICPIATVAQPAVRFIKDAAREQYQILLHSVAVARRPVRSIAFSLQHNEMPVLLFAVTAEA